MLYVKCDLKLAFVYVAHARRIYMTDESKISACRPEVVGRADVHKKLLT